MPRSSVRVSTKVGRLLRPNPGGESAWDADIFVVRATTRRVWDLSADGIRTSCAESLERLGLDRVDTLYLHDPEESPAADGAADGAADDAVDEGLAGLSVLRSEGVVGRIGVGSKSEPTLVRAAGHAATDELMVAGRHTLVDHAASCRLLPLCAERGIAVAAASVFNSGLLSTPEPAGTFEYADAPAGVVALARRIADVCRAHGTDLPTAALHHAARHPSVTTVVVGARTPAHVRQNVERAATPPPAALWDALAAEGLVPEEATP
jgi:D-threo-aldose 1-dehydrogenase